MIDDTDILKAVRTHGGLITRKRLAGVLDVDDDIKLAEALYRLVRKDVLERVELPGPGKNTGYGYRLTVAGKGAMDPESIPVRPIPEETTMSRIDESNTRRARILALITAQPGILANAIAEKLAIGKQVVHRDLFAMNAAGQIHHDGESRPFGYCAGSGTASTHAKATRGPGSAAGRKKAKPDAVAKSRRRARRPKNDALIAPEPSAATSPARANAFRVALTSDNTLIMQRRDLHQEVALQPAEIVVLTAFLRRLDQATPLTP